MNRFIVFNIFFMFYSALSADENFNVKSYVVIESGKEFKGWELFFSIPGYGETSDMDSYEENSFSDADFLTDSDITFPDKDVYIEIKNVKAPLKNKKSGVNHEKLNDNPNYAKGSLKYNIKAEEKSVYENDSGKNKKEELISNNKNIIKPDKKDFLTEEIKPKKQTEEISDDDNDYEIDRETIKKLRKDKLIKAKNRRGL